jgi:hypothetical protein
MAEDKSSEGGKLTAGDLRKMVSELVSEAVKGITTTTDKAHEQAEEHTQEKLDRPSSVSAAVQREIARIQAKEKQDERDKTIDEGLAKLSEVTAEKPPIERRRVHKVMGWGDPAA